MMMVMMDTAVVKILLGLRGMNHWSLMWMLARVTGKS